MSSLARWLLWAAVLLLAGCSPRALLNGMIPANGFREWTGIPYGQLPRQELDVYRPAGADDLRPTVVFFYGGSWQSGEREAYRFLGEALTAQGFVVVIPDYRLYPEVTFPAFVEDGARAVRWTRENVRRFGGDPERIFLMGHSAGGHIAALLALDPRYLREQALPSGTVRGWIGLAGAYDFTPADAGERAALDSVRAWPLTQPVNWVHRGEPPALLLQGLDDQEVTPDNAEHLARRIREVGGCVTLHEYPDVDHNGLLISLWQPFLRVAPALHDLARWIRERSADASGCPDPEQHPNATRR